MKITGGESFPVASCKSFLAKYDASAEMFTAFEKYIHAHFSEHGKVAASWQPCTAEASSAVRRTQNQEQL